MSDQLQDDGVGGVGSAPGAAPAVGPVNTITSQLTAIVQTICLVVIVALLTFALVSPVKVEESPEQQWEYMIQSVPDVQFADTMTLYGLAGWELAFARRAVIRPSATERLRASRAGRELPDEPVYEVIFKRPSRDTAVSIND